MKIGRVYSDGSFIKIYEPGDIVKIVDQAGWLVEPGEIAKVTSISDIKLPNDITQYVDIITESMKRGGWQPFNINTKNIEPYGKTLAQIPGLIQEWKEQQVKTLLIGEK